MVDGTLHYYKTRCGGWVTLATNFDKVHKWISCVCLGVPEMNQHGGEGCMVEDATSSKNQVKSFLRRVESAKYSTETIMRQKLQSANIRNVTKT